MRESRRQNSRIAIVASAAAVAIAIAAASLASETARPAPEEPHFLVATRAMPDSMFAHSVILLIPSVEFPLVAGVILNKPSAVPIRNLFPDSAALKNKDDTAFFGGPVALNEATLILRAAQPIPHTVHVFDDVYASIDAGAEAEAVKNPALTELRVFLGRAQWLDDQLHAESLAGAWYIVPAKADLVFSDPAKLWSTLVERAELQEAEAIKIPRSTMFALLRVLAGLCVPDVYAQEPTLTPTPSLSSQNEPTPAASPGPANTGSNAIQMTAPSTAVNVGDAVVPVPDGDCAKKIRQALANQAPIPVSEPDCAVIMNEALSIQRKQSQSSPRN
ncbi:MAG TPA: YqgE/AlgH family protein [Candidatus Acidoferrales bacterium]|nr:YqgE/AlgH family protein [Candidatus Acidoferrales bacterium]